MANDKEQERVARVVGALGEILAMARIGGIGIVLTILKDGGALLVLPSGGSKEISLAEAILIEQNELITELLEKIVTDTDSLEGNIEAWAMMTPDKEDG